MFSLKLIVFLCSFYINSGFIHHRKHGINFLLDEFKELAEQDPDDVVQTMWIEQLVDNDDSEVSRRWKMKYFQRLDMFKEPNGPIYFMLGGESNADPNWLRMGLAYELAKETQGLMFLTEHRYYGDSKPFENFTTENLQFLSSRQALADNARLLRYIKTLPLFSSSKVVVVGGSYAGNLAVWMKLLYPDLVDAVIASSAPVLAKVDFYEYLETVGDDLVQYGTPGCFDYVSKTFARYEELLKTADGIKQLKKEENICENSDLTKPENKQLFYYIASGMFGAMTQYGNPARIKDFCKHRSLSTENNVSTRNKNSCFPIDFSNMLIDIKNATNGEQDAALLWTYQTCTEFGYYQTTNSKKQPFGKRLNLDFDIKICQGLFGPTFDEKRVAEGVRITNEMYESLHPNVTNVVFVNGAMDPWHRLGVLKDLSHDAPAKVIPFASHCADLLPDRPGDPEELREARKYIKTTIKKWIGAENHKKFDQ